MINKEREEIKDLVKNNYGILTDTISNLCNKSEVDQKINNNIELLLDFLELKGLVNKKEFSEYKKSLTLLNKLEVKNE